MFTDVYSLVHLSFIQSEMAEREGAVPGGHTGHQADGADHDRRRHRPRAPQPHLARLPRVLRPGGRLLPLR